MFFLIAFVNTQSIALLIRRLQVCPLLTAFVKSSAAAGWPTNPDVPVAANVRQFLQPLLTATELLNPTVYRYCFDLETAQDRVAGLPYPTISPRPTPPPVTAQPSISATHFPTTRIPNRNTYQPVLRINCGSTNDYTSNGIVWSKDINFNTGKRYVANGASIPRAIDPFIYRSDRWDPPGDVSLKYTIAISPSATEFLVRLHFCELFFPNILSRLFDVSINGMKVLDRLDIVADAQGWFQPLVKEIVIYDAPNNKIEIEFTKVLENPKYVHGTRSCCCSSSAKNPNHCRREMRHIHTTDFLHNPSQG
jgi:Malectin domain